jgi:dTDP-4-amino-4,6-dideoxygalactose transaminase
VSSPNSFKIPIVDLRAQYDGLRTEVGQAIDEVLASQHFILGPAVERFEQQLAAFLQCGYGVGAASGSDALLLALMALGIGPRDGVLVPTFTFFSTVSSITRLGATPLFIDSDEESHLISPSAVRSFIEERCRLRGETLMEVKNALRVRTILPVHLFGRCCTMAEFAALAKKCRLTIVEDVAQACGARSLMGHEWKFAGTIGDLGCFSFFPSKNLGAYGDGGFVATGRKELADRVRMLRVHGERTKYYHELIGLNSRLDSIQAAVLSVKLRYLDGWCEQRNERAYNYYRLFHESGLLGRQVIRVPATSLGKSHVFNNYVISVERRDELKRYLADQGIQSEIYYPLPLHLQSCFAHLGYKRGDFPAAEMAATQVLALPMYPEMTLEQQEFVVSKIIDFFAA